MIYAKIPFKIEGNTKVDQIFVAGERDDLMLYVKIDDYLFHYDLTFKKKFSVHQLIPSFDPSYMQILQDGDTYIGIQDTRNVKAENINDLENA